MTTHETPAMTCPGCGVELGSHVDIRGSGTPRAGDGAICMYCSQISILTNTAGRLQFRVPTDDEQTSLLKDPRMLATIAALRNARERTRP